VGGPQQEQRVGKGGVPQDFMGEEGVLSASHVVV
jgi:hypothetical protein